MGKIIISGLRAAALVVVALSLAACQTEVILLDDSGKAVGKLETTSPARLTLDGKEYTGQWVVTKIYEEDLAKSRRRISNRAYTAYLIGNDPAKLKHGHASLIADDGSKITCDFYYRSQPHEGSCDMDGKQLHLTVQ